MRWLVGCIVPDRALRWQNLTRSSLTATEACLLVGCPPSPSCGLTGRARTLAENQAAETLWARRLAAETSPDNAARRRRGPQDAAQREPADRDPSLGDDGSSQKGTTRCPRFGGNDNSTRRGP